MVREELVANLDKYGKGVGKSSPGADPFRSSGRVVDQSRSSPVVEEPGAKELVVPCPR